MPSSWPPAVVLRQACFMQHRPSRAGPDELARGLAPPPRRPCWRMWWPAPLLSPACRQWPSRSLLTRARPAGSPFVVRIWEAEACQLHAVGEAAPGLLGPLAWQPNGRHLYAAQAAAPAAPPAPLPRQQAAGQAGAEAGKARPGFCAWGASRPSCRGGSAARGPVRAQRPAARGPGRCRHGCPPPRP